MKNNMIKTSIYALLMAAYLIYPGDIFAQGDNSKKSYRVKIIKEENGETTKIDKNFKSEEEMNEYLSKEGVELGSHNGDNDPQIMIYKFHSDDDEISEEIKVEMEMAQDELKKAMKEMKMSKKEMKMSKEEFENIESVIDS